MSECSDIVKAIQELSEKIDSYKKEINDKFDRLDLRIRNLENKVNAHDKDIKNLIAIVNKHELRIRKLEKEIFYGVSNNNNYSRNAINRLKQQVAAIERYINALDRAGTRISTIILQIAKVFSFF
mgnify:CR=1 FL=1